MFSSDEAKVRIAEAKALGMVARDKRIRKLECALRSIRAAASNASRGRFPHGYTSAYTTLRALANRADLALTRSK